MKYLKKIIFVFGIFLLIPTSVRASAKYGILAYVGVGFESPALMSWINNHFVFKIQGTNSNDPNVLWSTYHDITVIGSIADLLKMNDWSVVNNVSHEEMLLHAKIDYTSTLATAWSGMDKFDKFEGANGVLRTADAVTSTTDGLIFTDLTNSAYGGSVTWQNTMYLGYEEPFDVVNLTFSTSGNGITNVWEFWNGSQWETLTTSGVANNLTANGQINFVPPASWTRKVINGSRNKYFVRCRITASSINPVTSSIKGDNWLRGANNLCMGWDATDGGNCPGVNCHIVNQGTPLEYNPSPPVGASARFRYQSRIPSWSYDHFMANPADFQLVGGVNTRTWAKYTASRIDAISTASGATAIMCDDAEKNLTAGTDGIDSTNTDFIDKTANSWITEYTNKYQDIVNYVRLLKPTLKLGINGQNKDIVKMGDWNLAEYHTFVWQTASSRGITVNDDSVPWKMRYDDYLPANNPENTLGFLIYQDTQDTVPGGRTAIWDRGNRGPIVALSKHYIAMNDNTIFSYYSKGGFIYSETDEVYLKDNTVLHQSIDAIPSVDQVKRWATYFPAMGVDLGLPGVRNFSWKSHIEIGGPLDVWRRDFANGIVLHRGALWNTTDAEYNTYSPMMDLGGGTYYSLKADGSTGGGITSISLRTGEGAILMNAPINADVISPTAPVGLSVQ